MGDVPTLPRELNRVLKPGRQLLIGFLNWNSELGQLHEGRKQASTFYREARLYAVEEVAHMVKSAGFPSLRFCQTLFGPPSDLPTANLEVREGHGEGSFVVLSATKADS